jgi:hypothetical protein
LLAHAGIGGLLHPEGVYDDPNGGHFRAEYYPRLRAHYQHHNGAPLFADVDAKERFSINLFGSGSEKVNFVNVANLSDPLTIRRSVSTAEEDRLKPIPGFKDEEGRWDTRGHPDRVITISGKELLLFTNLFEDSGTPPEQARLPQIHSRPLIKVLGKIAKATKRLADFKGRYIALEMLHEANAQRDGIITREQRPSFSPSSAEGWVISGPHFYVGNPFNKSPRTKCIANSHYDSIDLESMGDDFLPRAVYRPGDRHGNLDAFYKAIPEWPKPQKPVKTDSGWKPGFWPVAEHEVPAYEALLENR